MSDVTALASDAMEGRGTGTEGAARARSYIAGRFAELGLEVEEQPFAYVAGQQRGGINLIARIDGSDAAAGVIVVTAHYDHVGIMKGQIHNGADDNASGVAALLALAAELKRRPPVHDVLLVALDAEEVLPEGMYGARAFVAAPPVALSRILFNLNLDMVSRGDDGDLWAAGAGRYPALRPLLDTLAANAPLSLRLGHDGTDGDPDDWTMQSDQGPFHAAGIPFIFFSVVNHADYHEPTDDASRIDPRVFSNAMQTILAAFRAFDAAPRILESARAAAAAKPPRP